MQLLKKRKTKEKLESQSIDCGQLQENMELKC